MAELKDLLVYMYHGEVRVEQERIAKLLHTAQILEIRGLRDINQKLDQELDSGVSSHSSQKGRRFVCQAGHNSIITIVLVHI